MRKVIAKAAESPALAKPKVPVVQPILKQEKQLKLNNMPVTRKQHEEFDLAFTHRPKLARTPSIPELGQPEHFTRQSQYSGL